VSDYESQLQEVKAESTNGHMEEEKNKDDIHMDEGIKDDIEFKQNIHRPGERKGENYIWVCKDGPKTKERIG
jgi:hypothetical protein